jgi:hypothetical protein
MSNTEEDRELTERTLSRLMRAARSGLSWGRSELAAAETQAHAAGSRCFGPLAGYGAATGVLERSTRCRLNQSTAAPLARSKPVTYASK